MLVEVKQGILKGGKRPSVLTGKEYYHFSGIPYAEPPIGNLRFRPPVPVKKWTGVRNVDNEGDCCIQMDFFDSELRGSEDCLYLNVYTPEPPNLTRPLKAVMVYIHGGGYFAGSGSSETASPDFLMGHDIIIVTFNYRLHILGFLSLNIPSCSGNYGLKDQSLALKWVHENIRLFGGDPNNVTIFGESAGASSVHLQMISPMSKGLFQRAILQSGSALAPWANIEDPENKAFKVGEKLGFDGTDPEKLADFLRKTPVNKLYEAMAEAKEEEADKLQFRCNGLWFAPTIEKISENAFLPDYPKNLLKTAEPMSVISGVDEVEGVIIFMGKRDVAGLVKKVVEDPSEVIKDNISCDPSNIPELASKVKEFYFKNCDPSNIKDQFINMYSDIFFLYLYDSLDYIVRSPHPVYFYEFNFAGELNQSLKWMAPVEQDAKAAHTYHADELGYIFYLKKFFQNKEIKEAEKKVIRNLTTLWTNFAKTGNPTPSCEQFGLEWKRHTREKPAHLRINENTNMYEDKIWNERRTFWTNALKKYA